MTWYDDWGGSAVWNDTPLVDLAHPSAIAQAIEQTTVPAMLDAADAAWAAYSAGDFPAAVEAVKTYDEAVRGVPVRL